LWTEYGAAFGSGDARAIAALYVADGDMIAVDGELASGPAAIEAYYRRQLSGAYQGVSLQQISLDAPRCISDGIALMNASWFVHGAAPVPFRVRSTFVVRREAAGWRYVAARFAAALSPPEFFGPVGEFLAGRWPAAAEAPMRGSGV
jgi:uncharacterized protein (TIGR02246 family)